MGKSKQKFIVISGFDIHDNNRGTQALGYGSLSFLEQRYGLTPDTKILNLRFIKNPLKQENRINKIDKVRVGDKEFCIKTLNVFFLEKTLLEKFHITLPFTPFGKAIRNMEYVAAINGGDGFSDIYSTQTFYWRLPETLMAIKTGIPTIQLPQTLGPFEKKENYALAKYILQAAKDVYVRDDRFVEELKKMGVKYELTNDLSYFMQPEPFDIKIENGAIGLNVSGLTYSNHFRTLAGQFENYHYLCEQIVRYFQSIHRPIYLISHSYGYQNPETDNDDLEASRIFYSKLKSKEGVHLIDMDLISPKTKYVISKMSFFIGTRMHANFAAIFTKVPVFGLAYSYKFKGAFENNGIFGQTAMINNISKSQADDIVKQIVEVFKKYNK